MEGLVMNKFLVLGLIFSFSSFSQEVVSRMYFSEFMGHVHKAPDNDSSSLTAVQCGFKVKVLKVKRKTPEWSYVSVGEDKGFIKNSRLSSTRPNCFQGKYQEFYNSLNLDLTDLYYLGKLNEQAVTRESKSR